MSNISRELCRAIRADLEAALKEINAKHGVNLSTCTVKYGDEFSCKVRGSLVVADEDGTVVSEELQLLRRLVPHLEGRSCRLSGSRMDIIGVCIDSKGRARRTDGDLAIQLKGAKGGVYKAARGLVCRNVITNAGLADPQPIHTPVAPEVPIKPEVPAASAPSKPAANGSKKEQMITFMLDNPNSPRASVISYAMHAMGMTKASASSTYQNAKVVVEALNKA